MCVRVRACARERGGIVGEGEVIPDVWLWSCTQDVQWVDISPLIDGIYHN